MKSQPHKSKFLGNFVATMRGTLQFLAKRIDCFVICNKFIPSFTYCRWDEFLRASNEFVADDYHEFHSLPFGTFDYSGFVFPGVPFLKNA